MTPIETIRKLSSSSNDLMLDKSPCYENDIFDVLWMLVGTNPEKKIFIDVPAWAICAFTHLNFAYPGTSWRKLLYPSSDGLKPGVTGKGWTDGVFDYFANPMGEKWFPAQSSTNELRLHGYGNLVSVTNGVHRAIGAVNYLIATQGSERAVLQQASVTYQPIDSELLNLLQLLSQDGSDLWLSWVQYRVRDLGIYVMAVNKYGTKCFHYKDKAFTPLNKLIPLTRWLMEFGRKVGLFKGWHPIAKEHLWILTRESWCPETT